MSMWTRLSWSTRWDLHDGLVGRGLQHAVIAAAARMVGVYRATQRFAQKRAAWSTSEILQSISTARRREWCISAALIRPVEIHTPRILRMLRQTTSRRIRRLATLAHALLREDAGFHDYQMLEAGVRQWIAPPGSATRRWPHRPAHRSAIWRPAQRSSQQPRRRLPPVTPTHALFADQSHSIPDNLVALLSYSRAWICSDPERVIRSTSTE
jgi:hypothetical protein